MLATDLHLNPLKTLEMQQSGRLTRRWGCARGAFVLELMVVPIIHTLCMGMASCDRGLELGRSRRRRRRRLRSMSAGWAVFQLHVT